MMRFPRSTAVLAVILGCLLAVAGCGDARTQPPEPAPERPVELGIHFDSATARTLPGCVTWTTPLPSVPPFKIVFNADSSPALKEALERPNPHVPVIDPTNRGIRNAVVFLRGIDPKCSKPWDFPAVTVEIKGRQYHVMQSNVDARTGFVRKGESITIISREPECHSVHATGAAFFTLSFPDANEPLTRQLDEPGVVEICSNAGFIWMRSHLFVTEHPYITRTDAEGRFVLKDVPPGEYELVAWLPNWNVVSYDRDPETGFRTRVHFAPPLQVVQKVRIGSQPPSEQSLEMSSAASPSNQRH